MPWTVCWLRVGRTTLENTTYSNCLQRSGGSPMHNTVSIQNRNLQHACYSLAMYSSLWRVGGIGQAHRGPETYKLVGAVCGKRFARKVAPRSWNMCPKSYTLENALCWLGRAGRAMDMSPKLATPVAYLGEGCVQVFLFTFQLCENIACSIQDNWSPLRPASFGLHGQTVTAPLLLVG